MSGFSADWLSLREPYDLRARSTKVLAAVSAALAPLPALTIVDLACGTGSTLRALAPHLPAHQNWKLVDNDLGLLARAANASHPRARVTTTPIDLVRDLEAALDGPLDLVTTSGLLASCFRFLARTARDRSRGARASVLCSAILRRPDHF